MPTQEPYQPLNISTGSAQQAIQSTQIVTPALENLMQGISSGFIAADDIRKRVQDGPLEAATRQQDLADVQQIRPLRRDAAVAQLENVKAQEQFEAESLPILNDTKREQFQQEYQNVLQHGHPKAVMDLFNKAVPGWMPYDKAKLFPKEGGLNTAYALEILGKAIDKANAQKEQAGAKPFTITNVDKQGTKTTSEQHFTVGGKPVGAPIPTGVQEPSPGANVKEAKSTRYNPAKNVEEEIIQRYNPNTGALIGEAIVVSENPIKLTAEQANALQFSSRMDLNNQIITDLEAKGFEPTAFKTTVQKWLPNRLQPEQLQSYTAAQRNWITATLRKESGAAISAGEYSQANKEYFPRDGDSPAVVKQKAALRELAEENIRMSSGRAQGATLPVATTTPGASTGVSVAPVISTTDQTAAAAEANALPPNVPFFQWSGKTYHNPNYRP